MTYTIATCTVKNSWWWTEELSETCRVLFQKKKIWEISVSSWFYYKNLSRCTVTGTSNSRVHLRSIYFPTDHVHLLHRRTIECCLKRGWYNAEPQTPKTTSGDVPFLVILSPPEHKYWPGANIPPIMPSLSFSVPLEIFERAQPPLFYFLVVSLNFVCK